MAERVFYTDFKSLRNAYNEVKTFIEKQTHDRVSSLKTKLEEDLGCAGDDNAELLERFIAKYKLDATGFEYSKHFLSEGELFGTFPALITLLGLPIFTAVWLIKLISLGKIDGTQKKLFPGWQRKTTDLTFGDLLAWYVTGKFNLHKDIQINVQTTPGSPDGLPFYVKP